MTLHGIRLTLYVRTIVIAGIISLENASHYILTGVHNPDNYLRSPTPIEIAQVIHGPE